MACNVKPNPRGDFLNTMGGFKLVVSGERSRDGEGSLDDAVEDPPGDPTG